MSKSRHPYWAITSSSSDFIEDLIEFLVLLEVRFPIEKLGNNRIMIKSFSNCLSGTLIILEKSFLQRLHTLGFSFRC